MANGWTNEQILDLLLEGQNGIKEDIRILTVKVDEVISKGCAQLPTQNKRLDELEGWRTKGIIGIITLTIGILVEHLRK